MDLAKRLRAENDVTFVANQSCLHMLGYRNGTIKFWRHLDRFRARRDEKVYSWPPFLGKGPGLTNDSGICSFWLWAATVAKLDVYRRNFRARPRPYVDEKPSIYKSGG